MNLRHVILGLFFFLTMVGLGVLTVYLGSVQILGEVSSYVVFFADVDGLRDGDPVELYGKRIGRISSVDFTGSPEPARRLQVRFAVPTALDLREDYAIEIADQTLLGGKKVSIELGSGPPHPKEIELMGRLEGGPLGAVGELIEENRPQIRELISSLDSIVTQVARRESSLLSYVVSSESHEKLDQAIANLSEVSRQIREGDGTLGKLITTSEAHDSLKKFLDSGSVLISELTQGEGAIARLIREPDVYENFKATVVSVRQIIDRVDQGDGVVGHLLSSKSDPLYADFEQVIANLRQLSDSLTAGKGVAGRLLTDDAMAQQLSRLVNQLADASENLERVVQGIRDGKGVVGYLFTDEEARREVRHIVAMIAGALEDAREAAPVQSLASFLFGTF